MTDALRSRRVSPRAPWLLLLLAACGRAAPEPTPGPEVHSARPIAGPPEAAGLRYLERVTGGAAADERLPLVVAIHGLGDRPEAFAPIFDQLAVRARLVVPYGEPWAGGGFSWFPVGGLDDPALLAEGTSRASDRLAAMIEALVRTRPTAGKPIITGFSQGGMLTFTLAVRHPEAVGAAFPIGGLMAPSLVPTSWPMGRVAPPIRAFHGVADERVPIRRARETVDSLRALGLDAALAEYPGVGHSIPLAMRAAVVDAIGVAATRAAR